MRTLKFTVPHMRGPDVEAWQQFLASQGFYKGPVNGDFDDATEAATLAYQRKSGLHANGEVTSDTIELAYRDGFSGPSSDSVPHYRTEGNVVLSMEARTLLGRIADEYYWETGAELVVTSGTRTPKQQADAMYKKLRRGENLRSLYRNAQALDEILKVYDDERRSGAGERATIDAMTRVIQAQVSRHVYISLHLRGEAVDVRSRTMSTSQRKAFEDATREVLGHLPKHETDHYHLQFR